MVLGTMGEPMSLFAGVLFRSICISSLMDRGCSPPVSNPSVLSSIGSYSSISNMHELRRFHAHILIMGLFGLEIFVRKIITFCSVTNPSLVEYGRTVFNQIDYPSTYIWNTMIRGYGSSQQPLKAIDLYKQMLREGARADCYTFPFLLKASYTEDGCFGVRRGIHCRVLKTGFDSDVFVMNSLIHCYGLSSKLEEAHRVFDEMSRKDVATWTTLLSAYANSHDMEKARKLFEEMPMRSEVTWSAMIAGYVRASCFEDALDLFRTMQEIGIEPNDATLVSLLWACSHLGSLSEGRWVHSYVQNKERPLDTKLTTALIDMYCKCGSTENAMNVFNLAVGRREVSVWTAMISGYALHGSGKNAIELFDEMTRMGIKPNELTMVAVLSACTHSGLVKEALSYFDRMRIQFCIEPKIEHYGCLVDLLGRAGLILDAVALIRRMPMRANAAVWGALFAACRIHGYLELGKQVVSVLLRGEPQNGALYMALLNLCSENGTLDEATRVRREMKMAATRKSPGCSAIEVDGVCKEFVVGDESHADVVQVCSNLNNLVYEIYGGTIKCILDDSQMVA